MPGTCSRCNRGVRLAERKQAFGKTWHALCFSCRTCRKLLDSRTATAYCGDLYCKSCQASLSSAPESRGKKWQVDSGDSGEVEPQETCLPCKVADGRTSPSKKSRVQEESEVRLRGGGNEIEVECYYESNEKQCLHSACPAKSNVLSPSEESVELRSNVCTREAAAGKTGCSSSRSFHGSSHKFANGQTDCSECTTRCAKSTYGCPQAKESPLKCEAPFKIRCPPSKNSRAHQQNLLDTELRRIRDSKELITRYSASETSKSNIPPPRKLPYPTPRSPLPSRRRVSFDGVTEIDKCSEDEQYSRTMQDPGSQCCCRNEAPCNDVYNHSCDIWRADDKDDCPGKDDDDDYDSAPETSSPTNCEGSRRVDYISSITHYPNLQPRRASNESTKVESRVEKGHRDCGNMQTNESTADFPLKETESHTSVDIRDDIGNDERMRGGCCDSYCSHCSGRPSSSRTSTRRVREHCPSSNNCFICCRSKPCERTIQEQECSSTPTCCECPSCCDRRRSSSSQDKPICKSTFLGCRQPKGCGTGGCCGSGCRGGCGRPGQTCLPSTPCQKPPCRTRPSSAGSSCSSRSHGRCDHNRCDHDRCAVPQICCCSKKPTSTSSCSRRTCSTVESYACGGSGTSCCRSCSPGCRSRSSRGCCGSEGGKHSNDGASCCRPKYSGCECLGGGLDCQRCGRKVYQAEMQMVSGSPFHNACFSCHCCRKPLEPLTYQENCGEIYCKQCYVRNFGPQGYGYGVGAGALQTPL